jgi:CCR4-NOT transcriptional complex subunit CAF120
MRSARFQFCPILSTARSTLSLSEGLVQYLKELICYRASLTYGVKGNTWSWAINTTNNDGGYSSSRIVPMAPIATQTPQSPQPRPALANQTHSRSSSFFSFLTKQSSNSAHHRTVSTVSIDNGSDSPPSRYLSPRMNSPPAEASPPSGHDTPSPQQSPSLQQQQPSYLVQQQQQMARTPAVQSPLARDPSTQATASTQPAPAPAPASQPPPPPPGPPPLHPEIRSVVHLTAAHAHKIYFSGPLVRRVERQPDGHRPNKDEGWCEVWAQLGGTTLSIWDMKQIKEASKQGKEVPPTYVNVTDAASLPTFQWF